MRLSLWVDFGSTRSPACGRLWPTGRTGPEDVYRGIDIAVLRSRTRRSDERGPRASFLDGTALATNLRRTRGVLLDDAPASFFRFAVEPVPKGTPPSVENMLR